MINDLDTFMTLAEALSGNLQLERFGFEAAGNYVVSTVDTNDMGLETAVLSKRKTTPVERYKSKKAAKAGHAKWVKYFASRSKKPELTITELGYKTIPSSKVKVKPMSDKTVAKMIKDYNEELKELANGSTED